MKIGVSEAGLVKGRARGMGRRGSRASGVLAARVCRWRRDEWNRLFGFQRTMLSGPRVERPWPVDKGGIHGISYHKGFGAAKRHAEAANRGGNISGNQKWKMAGWHAHSS